MKFTANKLVLFSVAAATALLLTLGTSMAYFTDTKSASPIEATMGGVKISLDRLDNAANGKYMVVPGSEMILFYSVTKTNSPTSAYIRAKFDINIEGGNNPAPLTLEDLGAKINKNWTLAADGYYYYNVKGGTLGGSPLSILDSPYPTATYSLKFPTTLGNEYQNAKITINAKAEAIQTQDVKQDLTSVNPWGDASAEFTAK